MISLLLLLLIALSNSSADAILSIFALLDYQRIYPYWCSCKVPVGFHVVRLALIVIDRLLCFCQFSTSSLCPADGIMAIHFLQQMLQWVSIFGTLRSLTIYPNSAFITISYEHADYFLYSFAPLNFFVMLSVFFTYSMSVWFEHKVQSVHLINVICVFELQAEAVIFRGPHEDLKSFLEAVDLLKGVIHFFSSNKNFKSCEGVLNQVNNLLTKSKLKIEEEFRQLMSTYR